MAVWVQIFGGSGGGWSALACPSRGDSEATEGAHECGVAAEGGAGQPLVAVGAGTVFAFELVRASGRRSAGRRGRG